MKESSVTKNNKKLAGWIDEFVSSFATKKEVVSGENDNNEKIAEININDLPKVVWNDETYHVLIDENGASIINGFGNTATTIPGVKTIEEVNDALNAKQIVSENANESLEIDAEMEREIEKALAYTQENTVTADNTNPDAGVNPNAGENTDEQKAEQYVNNDPNANTNSSADSSSNGTTEDTTNTTQASIINQGIESVMLEGTSLLQSVDYTEKTAELLDSKFAELEDKINNLLNTKLAEMVEQFYARTNPGDVYDQGTEIQNQEIAKFTQEADETVKQIAEENSVDRTVPEGKYMVKKVVVVEETPVETEIPVSEETVVTPEANDADEIELPEEEEDTFKQGSCPCCNSKLAKNGINKNFLNIVCSNTDCNVEYKVNLDNEKIYLK